MLIALNDRNEVSESYFWLNLAHSYMHSAMIAVGMAKLHAGQGHAELKGLDDVTETLEGMTESVAASIVKIGGDLYGEDE